MSLWAGLPDWAFRALGCLFFGSFLVVRAPDYFQDFWTLGPYYVFENGDRLAFPWTRVLVDITILQMALSYLFRMPAADRCDRGPEVVVALLGGFWPMLPFLVPAILSLFDPAFAQICAVSLWKPSISLFAMLAGTTLILLGNVLDVWGYGVLFRSFSIVPEARALKVDGVYRWIRHPIYFGQMLAQAGIWMFFARTSLFSVCFLGAFIVLQLYRSKLEDRVLENAFGDRYRQWKAATFWFV